MSNNVSFAGLIHKKRLEKLLGIDYRRMKSLLDSGVIVPKVRLSRKTMYFDLSEVEKNFGKEFRDVR